MTGNDSPAKRKRKPQPPMEYEDRLFYMVRNLVEYGSYGKDPRKALKILRGYFPQAGGEQLEKDFFAYMKAYVETVAFVEEHEQSCRERYKDSPHTGGWEPTEAERGLMKRHPEVPGNVFLWMIGFIFDWHHMR